jgi:hypothetical protein
LIKGYDSVTDAMNKMGKSVFQKEFDEWIKEAKKAKIVFNN